MCFLAIRTLLKPSYRRRTAGCVWSPCRCASMRRPGESRLIRSNWNYLWRTGSDLVRILVIYRPFRSFMMLAIALFAIATVIGLRFVYYFIATDDGSGHIQSLVLAEILYGLSGTLVAVAFIGDLLAINRRLLEELRLDLASAQVQIGRPPGWLTAKDRSATPTRRHGSLPANIRRVSAAWSC